MNFSELEFYLKLIECFFQEQFKKLYIIFSTFLFSPKLFFLEARRRIFGKSYEFKGFNINSNAAFIFLYYFYVVKNRRYEIRKIKNGYILVDKKLNLNIFSNDFYNIIPIVVENSLDLRGYKLDKKRNEIKGRKILDIGGYIDTPISFSKMGAREVITFEPLYHKLLLKNLKINKIKNVIVKPYYVFSSECKQLKEWLRDKKIKKLKRKIVSWKEVLKENFDLAKVDCEGCEEGLLYVDNDLLRKIPVWIMEIHGNKLRKKIIEKFRSAGFRERAVCVPNQEDSIYRFEKIS